MGNIPLQLSGEPACPCVSVSSVSRLMRTMGWSTCKNIRLKSKNIWTTLPSHLVAVHDDVAVLVAAEDVVDADDGLLVLVLGVADQRGAHLHPRVAAAPVQEPEVSGHHLTLLDH